MDIDGCETDVLVRYSYETIDWNYSFMEDDDSMSDTMKIVSALYSFGISVDPYTASELWEERSRAFDSGYLILPSSYSDIVKEIVKYVDCFKGFLLSSQEGKMISKGIEDDGEDT